MKDSKTSAIDIKIRIKEYYDKIYVNTLKTQIKQKNSLKNTTYQNRYKKKVYWTNESLGTI